MVSKSKGHICISLNPASFVLKILENSIMEQTTRKSSTETFIETGAVQAIEESHVCQPSLLVNVTILTV